MIDDKENYLDSQVRLLQTEGFDAIPLAIDTMFLSQSSSSSVFEQVLAEVDKCLGQSEPFKVVTIDLNFSMRGQENFIGLDILKHIKKKWPRQKCIILTNYPSPRGLYNALSVGAEGFVDKSVVSVADALTLDVIIKGVIRGQRYYDGDQVLTIAQYIEETRLPFKDSDKREWLRNPLTERQGEVLYLVAEGLSIKEIASRLVIDEKTVGVHLHETYIRLHLDEVQPPLTSEEKRRRAANIATTYGWLVSPTK